MKTLAMGHEQCAIDRVNASDIFRRFKKETVHEVRQADVTGHSFAERVARTRQMLRSMDPEQALQVIEFHKGLNFFEALVLAQKEGKLIVPNDIHDRILMETTDKKYLIQNYSVWTGTLIIYEKRDKPFGKEVNFSWKDNNDVEYSISFKVPKQFRGKTNCALVVEHPDFELIDRELGDLPKGQTDLGNNNYEIKPLGEILLIENFPTETCKWYNPDPETKIPIGEPVKESKEARRLWRLDRAYIGSAGRVGGAGVFFGDRRCGVSAFDLWSGVSGVALVGCNAAEK